MERLQTYKQIRVLVVDDSAIMRIGIKRILEQDPRIKVVATARNGQEAIEKIPTAEPDMITMDIEMPVMDGLTALSHIMKENPTPVLMVSSLTKEGAEATFKALELGAVDYVAKGGNAIQSLNTQIGGFMLRQKVRAITANKNSKLFLHQTQSAAKPLSASQSNSSVQAGTNLHQSHYTGNPRIFRKRIVAIGTSTGGPMALQKVLAGLPADLPVPILIVQHMPTAFIEPFAKRLDNLSQIVVKQSEQNEILKPGTAYIGHGGVHLKINRRNASEISIEHQADTDNSPFVPSVDVMMNSVASVCKKDVLGVIMTGMGSDGLEGMKLIKSMKGATIAQDEFSCVVYGMPKACVDADIIDKVVPVDALSEEIINATN